MKNLILAIALLAPGLVQTKGVDPTPRLNATIQEAYDNHKAYAYLDFGGMGWKVENKFKNELENLGYKVDYTEGMTWPAGINSGLKVQL